jgi:putative membrane protein
MIRGFNDHAANERTFLAWVRTGLSAVALGIVVKKGSLLALVIAGVSSPLISSPTQDCLSSYGGSALIGTGIAIIGGAAVRFVRTALRIDDEAVHSAGIVRLASALSRRQQGDSAAVERVLTGSTSSGIKRRAARPNLRLVGGADASAIQ